MRTIQAVMFDLDGTIIDTLGDFCLALNLLAKEKAWQPFSSDEVKHWVGKGSPTLVRRALQARVAQHEVALLEAPVLKNYLEIYLAINGTQALPYKDTIPTLDWLKRHRVPIACVTNKPQLASEALFRKLGMSDYFACIIGGDRLSKRKPDPLPLLQCCEWLGFQPSNVLMVGDSINDLQAARSARCPIALVAYGYHHDEPITERDSDIWLECLNDLPKYVNFVTQ